MRKLNNQGRRRWGSQGSPASPTFFGGKIFFSTKIGVDEREGVNEKSNKNDIGRMAFSQKSDKNS